MKNPQMDEDDLYIEQFLGGQEKGFEALVRKYQDRLLNTVYSLIGRDRESEDMVQEVFLKVYHNLKTFRRSCLFSTWLYRIAVNTAYDFLRRRRHFVGDPGILESIPASSGMPQEVLVARERELMVRKAIAGLPFKYRTAVVLKDIEGLSYLEMSRIMRCSIGTVESRLYRGRQCLKEKLLELMGDAI